jgi:hypothetical protein
MQRTFNYTGRIRINQQNVHVQLEDNGDRPPTFNARLDLSDSLPPHCKVYVEAYRKQTSQRFDFGTIGQLRPPANRELTEVDLAGRLLFRVRVVDESQSVGSVIASGDRIKPQDSLGDANSMMPIKSADLGNVPWKLDIDGTDDYPVLFVNKDIPDGVNRFQVDRTLVSVVLPAALREALTFYIFLTSDDEKEGEARNNWLNFAGLLVTPLDEDADKEDKRQWIDEVIEVFSLKHRLVAMLDDSSEEEN